MQFWKKSKGGRLYIVATIATILLRKPEQSLVVMLDSVVFEHKGAIALKI